MGSALLKFIFTCIVFTPFFGWGQVVVISDIDDTLKESKILDTWESVENAFSADSFWLMPELYKALKDSGAEIFYLSNAPKEVMDISHRRFLASNRYPSGLLILPSFSQRDGHKIRWIQKIINERQPKTLILIGDNGEKDPEVYNLVYDHYKNSGIEIHTFIRMNYDYSKRQGTYPRPQQNTFVTAGEVAVPLSMENLISHIDAEALVKASITRPGFNWWWREQMYPGASIGLPDWINCKRHKSNLENYYDFSPNVEVLDLKIKKRCAYVID